MLKYNLLHFCSPLNSAAVCVTLSNLVLFLLHDFRWLNHLHPIMYLPWALLDSCPLLIGFCRLVSKTIYKPFFIFFSLWSSISKNTIHCDSYAAYWDKREVSIFTWSRIPLVSSGFSCGNDSDIHLGWLLLLLHQKVYTLNFSFSVSI